MKIPYSFSILRYIHDIISGEFINVGVVLYSPKANFLSAICTSKYGRLSKTFSNINGDHFRNVTRFVQSKLEEQGEKLVSEFQFTELPIKATDIVAKVLPKDDSSLQFSPDGFGVTDDLQLTLEKIFNRYVEKYYEKSERPSRSDEDVWKIYKKSLEEKRVLANLKPHQIIGNNYEYEFKYCWKNGNWQAQEPISFDLLEATSITDKANNWLGRITSLVDGGEKFKLNILIGAPTDGKLKTAFARAQNILHKIPCDHDFIKEDEANDFAERLKTEIESHKRGIVN